MSDVSICSGDHCRLAVFLSFFFLGGGEGWWGHLSLELYLLYTTPRKNYFNVCNSMKRPSSKKEDLLIKHGHKCLLG